MASVTVPDLRGKMFRSKRLMPDENRAESMGKWR